MDRSAGPAGSASVPALTGNDPSPADERGGCCGQTGRSPRRHSGRETTKIRPIGGCSLAGTADLWAGRPRMPIDRLTALPFTCPVCLGEAPMSPESEHENAARAAAHGHFRASHADRERTIDTLKAAFIQGRLTKDELELRVGQTLASRTYAELAALTGDIPAGV